MDYQKLLQICDSGNWKLLDDSLKILLKEKPDDETICAMSAHVALRSGRIKIAKWFIKKSQSLKVSNIYAQIEDICVNFYEANFETALAKINKNIIDSSPKNHPIHQIIYYLSLALGVDSSKQIVRDQRYGTDNVLQYLDKGDKLKACIEARLMEVLLPSEADTFAALGFFNTQAGFYKNADRNFHEAVFRNTKYMDLVNLNHFFIFCRQLRFDDAITIGFNIEKAGNLNVTGQALMLEMMLRKGVELEVIEGRLKKLEPYLKRQNESNPLIEVLKFKVALLRKNTTHEKILEILVPVKNRVDCPAAYLYFYADLISKTNMAEAKEIASRAITLDHLHPEANHWQDSDDENRLNFEFAGVFIPKEHEGGAWPTETQEELLEILFKKHGDKKSQAWREFVSKNSIYSLEAGSYRILPYLYKLMENENLAQKDLLKGMWKKSYIENVLKINHLIPLFKKIEAENIEIVLLKGLANAIPLYGDLGARPMSDVDILININDLQKAHEILTSEGWFTSEVPTLERARFAYAITYRHCSGGMLDVHWKPCEIFSNDNFDVVDLGGFEEIEFMNHKWKVLKPSCNLFCTIIHGVEWNHLSPVRWVIDSFLILEKYADKIDWKQIHYLAMKYNAIHILAEGLKYLQKHQPNILDKLPSELYLKVKEDYSANVLLKIRLRPRNIQASFEESIATIEFFRGRFKFTDRDYLFICGGDKPEIFIEECRKNGINWLPYRNQNEMIKLVNSNQGNYNLIIIDANLSCTFQCLNVDLNGADFGAKKVLSL